MDVQEFVKEHFDCVVAYFWSETRQGRSARENIAIQVFSAFIMELPHGSAAVVTSQHQFDDFLKRNAANPDHRVSMARLIYDWPASGPSSIPCNMMGFTRVQVPEADVALVRLPQSVHSRLAMTKTIVQPRTPRNPTSFILAGFPAVTRNWNLTDTFVMPPRPTILHLQLHPSPPADVKPFELCLLPSANISLASAEGMSGGLIYAVEEHANGFCTVPYAVQSREFSPKLIRNGYLIATRLDYVQAVVARAAG